MEHCRPWNNIISPIVSEMTIVETWGQPVRIRVTQSVDVGITTTRVVGTPQTVLTNPLMTTHVNRIIDWPSMNSMVVRGYKSVNATNPRRGYWKPFILTAPIPNHKDGHYVRPNMVAFKYLDLKKCWSKCSC
jgi:hypothetical protein